MGGRYKYFGGLSRQPEVPLSERYMDSLWQEHHSSKFGLAPKGRRRKAVSQLPCSITFIMKLPFAFYPL
jgi:hypothetical protein